PIDKIFRLIGAAIAIRVFKNRDAVGAFGAARWRLGNLVIDGARVAINFDARQAGGVWILEVLNDPKPAAIIEFDRDGLRDHRFAGKKRSLEAVWDGDVRSGFGGRVALGKDLQRRRQEQKGEYCGLGF